MNEDLQAIKEKILASLDEVNAKIEAAKPWPQDGDECFVLSDGGVIVNWIYREARHGQHLKQGRVFKTREQAEWKRDKEQREIEKEQLLYELEQYADEVNEGVAVDWRNTYQTKYCFVKDWSKDKVQLYNWHYSQKSDFPVFLKDVTDELQEKLGERLHLLFS